MGYSGTASSARESFAASNRGRLNTAPADVLPSVRRADRRRFRTALPQRRLLRDGGFVAPQPCCPTAQRDALGRAAANQREFIMIDPENRLLRQISTN